MEQEVRTLGSVRMEIAVAACLGGVGFVAEAHGDEHGAELALEVMARWTEAWARMAAAGVLGEWFDAVEHLVEVARQVDPTVVRA